MAISANDIRKGMVILHEGSPVKVMEFHHHTPGNLRAMVQARLRNLLTGNSFEFRFRSNDTLERVILEQHKMEYLYSDGSHHHFMNSENYEQVALTEEELGDAAQWLMPGLKIEVEFYNGTPNGVALPASMELTVATTEPQLKVATASNSNKPATLENGVTLMVPPFIAEGEKIRVNPAEARYMERVK
jgi:elongation factor P